MSIFNGFFGWMISDIVMALEWPTSSFLKLQCSNLKHRYSFAQGFKPSHLLTLTLTFWPGYQQATHVITDRPCFEATVLKFETGTILHPDFNRVLCWPWLTFWPTFLILRYSDDIWNINTIVQIWTLTLTDFDLLTYLII